VATGERQTFTVAGGPNAGKAYDFYLWAQQRTAAFEYGSLGSCALFAGHLFDATLNETTDTFFCNAWFTRFDAPSPTRSELQVDGANAYPVWAADDINGTGAGLPALTDSSALDPSTGNLAIHDAEPLVKCADPTYPPTATSCATFVPTGVTYTSTVSQDHDGHLSVIADRFSSTDGAAHTLDLEWENDQRFHGFTGDSRQLAYRFPGQAGFARHGVGDVVPLPAAPGTILIHMDGAPDGDPGTGRGAIVYDRPASSATFIYADAGVEELVLRQRAAIPARGVATFRFAYAQDYTAAGAAGLAAQAAAAFGIAPAPAHPGPTATPPPTAQPPRCKVPRLKGKTLRAARRALRRAHCRAGRVTRRRSRTVRRGRVISTSPRAGRIRPNGTKVRIKLSRGRR
jgi:hypothetical protein